MQSKKGWKQAVQTVHHDVTIPTQRHIIALHEMKRYNDYVECIIGVKFIIDDVVPTQCLTQSIIDSQQVTGTCGRG